MNVHGGACALGRNRRIGRSYYRDLDRRLKARGGKRGVAFCIGGGEATAMAIELV